MERQSNYVDTWAKLDESASSKSAGGVLEYLVGQATGKAYVLDIIKKMDFEVREFAPILDTLKNAGAIEITETGVNQKVSITEVGKQLIEIL